MNSSIKAINTHNVKTSFLTELKWKIAEYIPYSISDKWYKFCSFLNPRNSWARKVIPNTWQDKTELFRDFLFAGVVDYVEKEKCFDAIDFESSGLGKFELELKECYHWIVYIRSEAYLEIEEEWNNIDHQDGIVKSIISGKREKTYQEIYGKLDELEAKVLETDQKWLHWIIENRELFWT